MSSATQEVADWESISPLRRFYRAHLSRFAVFRLAKRLLLHLVLYPLSRLRTPHTLPVSSAAPLAVEGPLFFVDEWAQDGPDSAFIELKDCQVWPRSRFIAIGDETLCLLQRSRELEKAYKKYLFQEEACALITMRPKQKRVHRLAPASTLSLGGRWISITHSSSENWMHWMAEVLPLLVRSLAVAPANTGILHDAGLSPTAYETLRILAGEMPMLEVPGGHFVSVEKLLLPNATHLGWFMGWPREKPSDGEPYAGEFAFDQDGLREVRTRLLRRFRVTAQKRKSLFIQRRSYFRRLLNEPSVAELVSQHGFVPVEPGSLTLADQVRLFSQADKVVAQGGAAMANIMFMPEGSTVIYLAGDTPYVNRDYFKRYAQIFGVNCICLTNPVSFPELYRNHKPLTTDHPMNAEFACDIRKLSQAIEALR